MIAIISDIHGNFPALQAVLSEIDRIGCNTIFSLGDVAGYYCMINECIEELRNRGIINILGNHDTYLLGKGYCPRSVTANQCIEYQKSIISDENLRYLEESEMKMDNELLSVRHGGWTNPVDEYIEHFDFNIAKNFSAKIFASGHTHIQKLEKLDEIIYFNPGAVGQPRDNDPRAGFAIIDDNYNVQLCKIKYNIDKIVEVMRKVGFEDRIAECLYKGNKIRAYKTC